MFPYLGDSVPAEDLGQQSLQMLLIGRSPRFSEAETELESSLRVFILIKMSQIRIFIITIIFPTGCCHNLCFITSVDFKRKLHMKTNLSKSWAINRLLYLLVSCSFHEARFTYTSSFSLIDFLALM